jgi:proteasome lid subunit RPN8/RPN11
MNSRLTITSGVDAAIRAHGQETYPHECCGALVGRDGAVTAIVALPNTTDEGPRRRFMVRPSDYQLAERRATELGGDLLGFYHSHPDHPARPSQYDLDHAWPTFAYIIVSVEGPARENGEAASGEPRQSAGSATADAAAEAANAGPPRRSGGADQSRQSAESATADAKAGLMTVWYLQEDRSRFEEGTLNHGENSHPDPAAAVHR